MEKKIDIYKHQKKKLKIENPKKVSVIIPNYNYEKYIIERIDSVLMQTYPIYEIVILDDCSPDNSVKVINKKIDEIKKEHPEIKVQFIINEKNSGYLNNGKRDLMLRQEIIYGLQKQMILLKMILLKI